MTEQQLKLLGKIFRQSSHNNDSNELDHRILSAAKANAPKPVRWIDRFQSVVPLGSAGLAALSVMFTGIIFMAMSQMVAVDEPVIPLTESSTAKTAEPPVAQLIVSSDKSKLLDLSIPEKPVRPVYEAPLAHNSNQQSFAELELPDTERLLNYMQSERVREFAKIEVVLSDAMHEIDTMLSRGALIDARQRYAQLRSMCSSCKLPPTLEALASLGSDPPDSG